MVARLTELRESLAAAPERGQLPSQPLIEAAEAIASAMLQDVLDWRLIFELRPLRLPGG